MKVGIRVVRELLRSVACLEWCKSAIYKVSYVHLGKKQPQAAPRKERVKYEHKAINTSQTYIRMNGREIVNGQRILIIAYQSFDWKVTEDARMYKDRSTRVSSTV